MLISLNEYKGRAADLGRRVSNAEIAAATGIGSRTLDNIAAGNVIEIRGEYIDAISSYFAELLGIDIDEVQLVRAEPVALPLALNIRPDRAGRRVGEKGER